MLKKKFSCSLQVLLLPLLFGNAFSQAIEWKSITSIGDVKDIDIAAGVVWSGSDGGALKLDIGSRSVASFTNTEGLTANQIVAVEIDQHGSIWFALFDGILNRYSPDTAEWEIVEDYKGQSISDIVAFGDSLYIGLDIGVSLYTIDRMEVKETYSNLGLSSGDNLEKIGANSVFIGGTDIWVATDKGIAQSSLTLPNLQAPSSWDQYTSDDGLPTNEINKIVVLEATPYAATTSGVARLIDGQWQSAGLLGTNAFTIELVSANPFFAQNTVLVGTSSGVFVLNQSDNWERLGSELGDVTAIKTDDAGNIWIGRKAQGLAVFNFDIADWDLIPNNGPASNNFKSLTLDSRDRLWCASQIGGIHMLDGDTWTNFSRNTGLSSNDFRSILVDSRDRIWVGSWGDGINILEETGDEFSVTKIDTVDGILAGFINDPGFVLVNALAKDIVGNIWALNRQAVNDRIVAAFTPEGEYTYFLSGFHRIGTSFVTDLEIDQFGRIWIATEDRGVRVIDYRNTLFEVADDTTQGLDVASDDIFSNKINAIVEDKDGFIWIGTDEGLNFWFQGQVGNRFGLINNVVNTLGVDGRNNLWIGTANGVSVFRDDGQKLADYTSGNSPLVSNNVQSFAFNEFSGEVWIGTDNGLSRVQTLFTAPKEDLSQLTGYPNPFIIDGLGEIFTITNLAENTSVSIYNSAGFLVKSFEAFRDIEGAQAFWDGTDKDGNLVASGIYVYLAYTDNNVSAMGKVAVIRR